MMKAANETTAPAVAWAGPLLLKLAKHVLLIACLVVVLYPLLWMIASSFKPEKEIFSDHSLWPAHFTLDGMINGWNALGIGFGTFFRNSFLIAIPAVIGTVLSSSLVAFAFTYLEFPLKRLWFALMLTTLMLPYHVILIPQYVLFLHLGWVNTFLPLIVPKFLAADAFFVFLMVQFFKGIPRQLFDAALMDGCNWFKIYWSIILPISVPALATAAIFSFIWTWEDFLGPLVYLSDIKKYTVSIGLQTFVDSSSQSAWGPLFAMSTLSLVPMFIVFSLFQRLIINGIASSGIKR